MASFYLVLPSNVSGGTLSNFKVNLPDRISLTGEWEVALVEISYQNTWYNISKTSHGTFSLMNFAEGQQLVQSAIAVNNYENIKDLLTALEEEIFNLHISHKWAKAVPVTIRYKPTIGRVQVKCQEPYIYLFLSPRMAYLLGFDSVRVTKNYMVKGNKRISTAEHPPDIKAGFYFMYVYCDLVAPQIVGDKFAPLLKTLSVNSKFGDIVQRDFINPHYVPVLKKDFESIEINIKDDTGDFVPFNYGKTIIKLHFRRK